MTQGNLSTNALPRVRSLDHFVIAVRDFEMAGDSYERLGFHVLPVMHHIELGTSNRIFQLANTYVELVGNVDRAIASLRSYLMPRLECGDGLIMASLDSTDLKADRTGFDAKGLAPTNIVNARRRITMPDGSSDETDSHCFYLWRAKRLYGSLFITEHYKPHTIWIAPYQKHPNTARRVTRITYVSDSPASDCEYFSSVIGRDAHSSEGGRAVFKTARQEEIELLEPGKLTERFGELAPTWNRAQPIYGIALRYEVDSLDACREWMRHSNVRHIDCEGCIAIPPAEAAGVLTEFVARSSTT